MRVRQQLTLHAVERDSNKMVNTISDTMHHVASSKSRSGREKMVEDESPLCTGQLGEDRRAC